jgi:hypothetical protein
LFKVAKKQKKDQVRKKYLVKSCSGLRDIRKFQIEERLKLKEKEMDY